MTTVLPKAERGLELQATRVSVEPPDELSIPTSDVASTLSRRPYGPGDMIDGKYELEALLGRGGMGEVWTARNATLDVRRALKLIRNDTGSAESTDRLLHEAQAAARLAEPAIVRVFDFGKTLFGDPYIVMEMLEGEDLMSIIRRRERLSPSKAVRLLLPVIRALCTAHAHGIVHRDLKPENIFLAKLPDGRVQPKLLDFGIAKLKNARALRLTTDGAVMGSPLYMAPEQARGEDVDERADVWAICVVLYEAITGNPPFSGDDRAEVVRAAASSDPVRLSQHGVEDDSLWPIITRGLMKRREDRWSSMEELGRALARWLTGSGVVDDITGASLESSWFRSSRQSLFASSSPPVRVAPRFLPSGLGSPRQWRAILLETLVASASRVTRFAGSLSRVPRSRRWGIGLAVGLGAVLMLLRAVTTEPEGAAAREDTVPPSIVTEPATSAPVVVGELTPSSGVPLGGPAVTAAGPDRPDEAAVPEPAARAAGREPTSGRRKAARASGSSDMAKENRRSKLVDPYR
jgi:eukaryotic-like serine/threonine-protein kinase